jgi:hypothetical protein
MSGGHHRTRGGNRSGKPDEATTEAVRSPITLGGRNARSRCHLSVSRAQTVGELKNAMTLRVAFLPMCESWLSMTRPGSGLLLAAKDGEVDHAGRLATRGPAWKDS